MWKPKNFCRNNRLTAVVNSSSPKLFFKILSSKVNGPSGPSNILKLTLQFFSLAFFRGFPNNERFFEKTHFCLLSEESEKFTLQQLAMITLYQFNMPYS